jgi:deoxyribodipyrimidine photo-lyase
VFSPFFDSWAQQDHPDPVEAPAAVTGGLDRDVPSIDALGFEGSTAHLPAGGHDAARERLDAFLDGPIFDFAEARDVPAADGTSRLSADLKFGTVGIRTVWAATESAIEDAPDDGARESVSEFQRQLAWREFYHHVLAARPDIVSSNYREFSRPIEWRHDAEEIRAWKQGETGYPFVDAGMRQLLAEGWMHNRLRMVVTSFACKDLWLEWRDVHDYFSKMFVDAEISSMIGGIQWAYSIGTDAQPYFRVFNPVTQGERYDEAGEYIREWVPELEEVPDQYIHEPWKMPETVKQDIDFKLGEDYPERIVDHSEQREKAISRFEDAKEE